MVEILVIVDGASEPRSAAPTSLQRASVPTLDGLAQEGTLRRLVTVPNGLPAGSETAIPSLLGLALTGIPDRGAIEAAARGIEIDEGNRAWRIDAVVGDGGRAGEADTRALRNRLAARAPDHVVRHLSGHRLLVTGRPPCPVPPSDGVRIWPEGTVPTGTLDENTTIIAAVGAAAGLGRLLGARVVVPEGATGRIDTDLRAKARAASAVLQAGARWVVVHVGGADEASHDRDPNGKVRFLERVDRELLASLVQLARTAGARLVVAPDHGTDPRTGLHTDEPVPALEWSPQPSRARLGRRLTEASVVHLPFSAPAPPFVCA